MSIETSNEILNDVELQGILWACLDYWSMDSCAPAERFICYKWVVRRHQARFGGTFHRRYYRILDPVALAELLKGCNLN